MGKFFVLRVASTLYNSLKTGRTFKNFTHQFFRRFSTTRTFKDYQNFC